VPDSWTWPRLIIGNEAEAGKDMRNDNNHGKRRILCSLLFSLILAIAGREAPEFASLTDDVSNDGMAVSWAQQAAPQLSSRDIIPHERLFYTNSLFFSLCSPQGFSSRAHPPSITGQDLLRLLSLQRK
jgi:hypothetical protein